MIVTDLVSTRKAMIECGCRHTFVFHMKDIDYLLLVDYYFKWPEVHKFDNLSSRNTIAYVKSTFSRNGVPDIFFTDNGCQFSSQEFKDFATEYGLHIVHQALPIRNRMGKQNELFKLSKHC
jgi:hypothetical protein